MTRIERRADAEILDDGQILAARTGLMFPPGLQFQSWERAGPKLFEIVDCSAWYLGDWLVYGQEQYDDRYRLAVEKAGLDYQTLRNYAWVARKIPLARRRATLSFQHHAEVASLDPVQQNMWLDRAEKYGWSRNQLRKELRSSRASLSAAPADDPKTPLLEVSVETLDRWRRAASGAGTELEHWIVATLDTAARSAVCASRASAA